MPLRIIGGEARGRTLLMPKGIRPSASMTREAMFNLVANELTGSRVLDLYAGSGAIGLESLSRGAGHATFVERDQRCLSVLRRNLAEVGYQDRATVVGMEVEKWIRHQPQELAEVDLLFADPPYGPSWLLSLVQLLEGYAPTGSLIVIERSARDQMPLLSRLALLKEKRYGDSTLTILKAE